MRFSSFFVFFWLLSHINYSANSATKDQSPPQATSELTLLTNNPHLNKDQCGDSISAILETVYSNLARDETNALTVSIDIYVYSMNNNFLLENADSLREQFKSKGPKVLQKIKPNLFSILLLAQANNNPNVRVRILTDYEQSEHDNSKRILGVLQQSFPRILEIRTWGSMDSDHRSYMHAKTLIVRVKNDTEIIMGSFNWTTAARLNHCENCLLIRKGTPNLIRAFNAQFEEFWSLGTPFNAQTTITRQRAVPTAHQASSSSTSPYFPPSSQGSAQLLPKSRFQRVPQTQQLTQDASSLADTPRSQFSRRRLPQIPVIEESSHRQISSTPRNSAGTRKRPSQERSPPQGPSANQDTQTQEISPPQLIPESLIKQSDVPSSPIPPSWESLPSDLNSPGNQGVQEPPADL